MRPWRIPPPSLLPSFPPFFPTRSKGLLYGTAGKGGRLLEERRFGGSLKLRIALHVCGTSRENAELFTTETQAWRIS